MSLVESGSKKALEENIKTEIAAGKDPKQAAAIGYSVQRANDQIVSCAPESVTLETLNQQNRKYWANQGGEGTIQ